MLVAGYNCGPTRLLLDALVPQGGRGDGQLRASALLLDHLDDAATGGGGSGSSGDWAGDSGDDGAGAGAGGAGGALTSLPLELAALLGGLPPSPSTGSSLAGALGAGNGGGGGGGGSGGGGGGGGLIGFSPGSTFVAGASRVDVGHLGLPAALLLKETQRQQAQAQALQALQAPQAISDGKTREGGCGGGSGDGDGDAASPTEASTTEPAPAESSTAASAATAVAKAAAERGAAAAQRAAMQAAAEEAAVAAAAAAAARAAIDAEVDALIGLEGVKRWFEEVSTRFCRGSVFQAVQVIFLHALLCRSANRATLPASSPHDTPELHPKLPHAIIAPTRCVPNRPPPVVPHPWQLRGRVRYAERSGQAEILTGACLNMVLTGNPGTGKTTVARLVFRFLRAYGVRRASGAGTLRRFYLC